MKRRVEGLSGPAPGVAPDPAAEAAYALRGVWWGAHVLAGALALLAWWGPAATGDRAAGWLVGLPAGGVVGLTWLGRAARTRRVCLVLAAALVATLAVATAGVLTSFRTADTASLWQASVFAVCMITLLASWIPFRRAEAARERAERWAAMYEELR